MNDTWQDALKEGAVTGTVGALVSTAVLALLGKRGDGSIAAPVNAVSHWLWGDDAARHRRASWKYTALGFLTQHAASVFWATLYSRLYGHRAEAKSPVPAIVGGIATSATAYVIDYTITPKRLTPGYELRLDGKGMFGTYAALAAGFAVGAMLLARR